MGETGLAHTGAVVDNERLLLALVVIGVIARVVVVPPRRRSTRWRVDSFWML